MASATPIRLLEPLLDPAGRYPHFFNGRILTAADLRDERDAQRSLAALLGRAGGAGVVSGFEVTLDFAGAVADPPRLRVNGGLAVNGRGEMLSLPREQVVLSLGDPAQAAAADAGLFVDCAVDAGPASVAGASQLSLLVLCPASGFGPEKAPMRGVPGDGSSTGCGARYALAGVQFREVPLPLDALGSLQSAITPLLAATAPAAADVSMLRNLLAQACLGLLDPAAADDPLRRGAGTPAPGNDRHGVLDQLQDDGSLGDGDVPLALLCRSGAGLRVLDAWSVRRRRTAAFAGEPWPGLIGDRRVAETEATLLQFQDQLRSLQAAPHDPTKVMAKSHFRFLPSTGLLPVGSGGFAPAVFFDSVPVHDEEEVDPAFLRLLFDQSRYLDPVDLDSETELRLLRPRGIDGYCVFVRAAWQPAVVDAGAAPAPAPAPAPASGGTPAATGSVRVRLAPKGGKAWVAGKVAAGGKSVSVPSSMLSVELSNSNGRRYPLRQKANKALAEGLQDKDGIVFDRAGEAELFVTGLPAGSYTVKVSSPDLMPATLIKPVTGGAETRFSFELVPRKSGGGKSTTGKTPDRDAPAGWLKDEQLELKRLWLMDHLIAWPWPPQVPWIHDPRVIERWPEEFGDWAADWVDTLRTQYPKAPFDAGGVRVVFDPGYVPGQASADPYAYIVFGDSGAYAPLVATTPETDLVGAVSAGRAEIAGVDGDAASRLAAQGFDRIDIIANAWTSGIAGALGGDSGIAAAIVGSATAKVGEFADKPLQIAAIDAVAAKALDSGGYSMTTLAKASVAEIVTVLKAAGYSDAAAGRYAPAYINAAGKMGARR